MQQPTPASVFESMAQWALSAIAGALVVLVTFRTRLALMDQRTSKIETEVIRRLDAIDRRQGMMLEIVAHIARKVQVDARFTDLLVRFIAEEGTANPREDDSSASGQTKS